MSRNIFLESRMARTPFYFATDLMKESRCVLHENRRTSGLDSVSPGVTKTRFNFSRSVILLMIRRSQTLPINSGDHE